MGPQIKDLSDGIVAAMAVSAVVISMISLYYSRRSLRLSETQDQRRRPKIVARLGDSNFVRLDGGGRHYAFLLSVTNRSDAENAIAAIEICVRYHAEGVAMVARLPLSTVSLERDQQVLRPPLRLGAHDTVVGWCDFLIARDVMSGRDIDAYEVILTDSHDAEVRVPTHLVNEQRHAT